VFPPANVFSLGDIVPALGAAHVIYATMTDEARGAEVHSICQKTRLVI